MDRYAVAGEEPAGTQAPPRVSARDVWGLVATPGPPRAGRPSIQFGAEDMTGGGARQRRFDIDLGDHLVPGLLWTPAEGEGPWPLVLMGHGGSGSKREPHIVALGRRLAREHGIAAAAIDGPVHGDRRTDTDAPPALVLVEFAQLWANDGDAMTDAMVADWQATLDALTALGEVRSDAIGWWGVSMGAITGVPVVAADARVRAAVLGLMGTTGPTRVRIEQDAPSIRCPVLFLVQSDDAMFPRESALALFDTLGSPDKRLHLHPGGHGDVPGEAFEESAHFLATRLSETRR